MRLVSYLLKEIAEPLRRFYLQFSHRKFKKSSKFESDIHRLKQDGIFVIPNFISKEMCESLRDNIDQILKNSDRVWTDEHNSDSRIYSIELISKIFNFFKDDEYIKEIASYYTGRSGVEKTILGAKLIYQTNNLGSGGGWHRDSPHSTQFKAILYLSNVTNKNGPFEYIIGSHKPFSLLIETLGGVVKPSQYRYSEREVKSFRAYKNMVKKLVASEGTLILVDVHGIHRGAPIEEGERYALTLYMGDPYLSIDF